jgi:plastocyanin
MSTRRSFLTAGGLALASLAVPGVVRATARRAEIQMRSIPRGARRWGSIRSGYGSSPARPSVGTMASPGNLHATTAYHPRNANHSLRIPEAAAPWDSGLLVKSGDTFEVTLTDVYDYFCLPHEAAGMVGRIVVGRPGGPAALPFDYFTGRAVPQAWIPVLDAARAAFPSVAAIVADGAVRRPRLKE